MHYKIFNLTEGQKNTAFRIFVLLFLCSIVLLTPAAHAEFNLNSWAYYKPISISGGLVNSPTWVNIDDQVFTSAKKDLSDLRVINGSQEIPYRLVVSAGQELVKNSAVTVSGVSSARANFRSDSFGGANMVDGDLSTYWQNDYTVDAVFANFTVDFKTNRNTSRIKIYAQDINNTWTHIQIEGSNDSVNWQQVLAKSDYSLFLLFSSGNARIVVYPESYFRYLRFTFWHTGSIKINEIEIYGADEAKILFLANSADSYKLYYGNPVATQPSYNVSALYSDVSTPTVTLGAESAGASASNDSDSDGIINSIDNCPLLYNKDQKDSDGDGVGDACDNAPYAPNRNQADEDRDGVGDAVDNCPTIKNADQRDSDLNKIGDVCDDQDGDGVINADDNCVQYPNYNQMDKDRNGIGDVCEDVDKDGVIGAKDNCIQTSNTDQKDSDKDGIGDACDNCLAVANSNQSDVNDNGVGDACEDSDGDGIIDAVDNCPGKPNNNQADQDADGVGDACDNCVSMKNGDQSDTDKNGVGDICDDADKDGIINSRDNCPNVANADQKDQNNNGVGDVCEDYDNDGVVNAADNCPRNYNPDQSDQDKDGKGNTCDGTDDRWTEKSPVLLWVIIAVMVGTMGFLGFRLFKKTADK